MLISLLIFTLLGFLLYKVFYEIPKKIEQVNARAHLIELELKKLKTKSYDSL